MLFHGVPWRSATDKDPNYQYYLEHRNAHFEPFMRLPPPIASILGRILEPEVLKRMNSQELLDEDFFKSIDLCDSECNDKTGRKHHHFTVNYETQMADNLEQARLLSSQCTISRHTSSAHLSSTGLSSQQQLPAPPTQSQQQLQTQPAAVGSSAAAVEHADGQQQKVAAADSRQASSCSGDESGSCSSSSSASNDRRSSGRSSGSSQSSLNDDK
jgi:serine/threonine protein kinase